MVRRDVGVLVVVGLMGAGKTTLASALADTLAWSLRDSDADIEAAQGMTAATIAEERGRDALHDLEAAHVLDAVAGATGARPGDDDAGTGTVVAAAASVVEREAVRLALADVVVAWIDGPTHVLAERAAGGAHRPDYGELTEVLADQHARRAPLFRDVATVVVDATASTSEQVTTVIAAMRSRS